MIVVNTELFLFQTIFEPSLADFVIENNDSSVLLLPNASDLYEKSERILLVLSKFDAGMNIVQCVILLVGFLLNVFVASVLLLDKTKTSSDCYLISICLGDVTICVGALLSSQIIVYYPYPLVNAAGNIIGHIGG